MDRRPGVFVTRSLQLRSATTSYLGQRVRVIPRDAARNEACWTGNIHDVACVEVSQYGAHAGNQQSFLANRNCLRSAFIDNNLTA